MKKMIDKIYKVITPSVFGEYRTGESAEYVMIGDVLGWIDHNCNRIDNGDGNKSRNIDRHRDLIVQIYYYFINGLNKPIEDQSEDAILFIYDLIEGQTNKD